jgi:hypothetical protein
VVVYLMAQFNWRLKRSSLFSLWGRGCWLFVWLEGWELAGHVFGKGLWYPADRFSSFMSSSSLNTRIPKRLADPMKASILDSLRFVVIFLSCVEKRVEMG